MSRWQKVKLHAQALWQRDWAGRKQYAARRWHRFKSEMMKKVGLGLWHAPKIEGVEVLPQENLQAVWFALDQAYKNYGAHGRFAGKLLLIRADVLDDWDSLTLDDPLYGWPARVGGGVEAHGLPVPHLELFKDGNIEKLARLVEAATRRATVRGPVLAGS